ncbi:hypothetical protein Airi01_092980 [Actinoallomurus iriomotensis]|uniref:Uncharacterized protein n=2 Tax=Thermomonosporaceae TaxID=2012 RepID=A0A9W6RSC9_9ACTN|nr:hypothetical protein Airi01_092980 [Actinoallomurus iriomotensis]
MGPRAAPSVSSMNSKSSRNRRPLAVFVALSGLGLLGGLASPAGAFAAHTVGRHADVVHQRPVGAGTR